MDTNPTPSAVTKAERLTHLLINTGEVTSTTLSSVYSPELLPIRDEITGPVPIFRGWGVTYTYYRELWTQRMTGNFELWRTGDEFNPASVGYVCLYPEVSEYQWDRVIQRYESERRWAGTHNLGWECRPLPEIAPPTPWVAVWQTPNFPIELESSEGEAGIIERCIAWSFLDTD